MTMRVAPEAGAESTVSQDPFSKLSKSRRSTWIVLLVLALVGFGAGAWWYKKRQTPTGPRYITVAVSRGDVTEVVETSGTVQPVVQVQVGSQLSGRIAQVLVDFNDRVTRGQLLAEIDPTPFRATHAQARAAVQAAEAQLARARVNVRTQRVNLDRALALRAQELNAPADVDTVRGQHDLAVADVAVSTAEVARQRANLQTAVNNLGFTRITSPIDGVVITRSIDAGQTVAASFQSPTLFVLAADLTQMQIVANVDEADVSRLHTDQVALARVDAFQGRTFRGRVSEVRYGAVTTAGVVTYPAVITVANPDMELRPGMTATVTVVSARHPNVLRVPNAALRYVPGNGNAAVERARESNDPLRQPERAARRGRGVRGGAEWSAAAHRGHPRPRGRDAHRGDRRRAHRGHAGGDRRDRPRGPGGAGGGARWQPGVTDGTRTDRRRSLAENTEVACDADARPRAGSRGA